MGLEIPHGFKAPPKEMSGSDMHKKSPEWFDAQTARLDAQEAENERIWALVQATAKGSQ